MIVYSVFNFFCFLTTSNLGQFVFNGLPRFFFFVIAWFLCRKNEEIHFTFDMTSSLHFPALKGNTLGQTIHLPAAGFIVVPFILLSSEAETFYASLNQVRTLETNKQTNK